MYGSLFKCYYYLNQMLSYFSKNKIQSRIPYDSNDFLFRWKKIERVVSKQNIDGLLIIAGPDSNSNPATTKLLNWLFLGHSGELINANSYLPAAFHELILFISKNSMIFLPPPARKELSKYVYAIPTMQVFSPTLEQFENGETFSVIKISEFYRMVKECKKIGVLGEGKEIEKWPLIQSFALEQIGGGFFTMKYQVEDVREKVEGIYRNHDKHSLRTLTEITSKRMEGYLVGTTSVIESTPLAKRSKLTERELNEPISEAIQIQQLEYYVNNPKSTQNQTNRSSAVLFGPRTNDQHNTSNQTPISNNLHFTVDYSDANTRLRVCRTYFLSLGTKLFQQLIEQSIPQEDTFIIDRTYTIQRKVNDQYKNQNILVTLYTNLVQSTLESIVGITKDYRNLNPEFIKSTIMTRISKILKDIYTFFPLINIEVELFSYNSLGELQKIDFKDIISFKLTPHYHVIKASIKDIPAHDNDKIILGGVVFSESFILQEGCYMLFTGNIPYFDLFQCHSGEQVEIYQNLNPSIRFEQLGEVVDKPVGDCKLFIQAAQRQEIKVSFVPVFNVTIYFHQKGLRIYSDKLGWILVPFDYMKQPTVLNSVNGYWVQINLIDNLILSDYSANQVILGLTPKARELFVQSVSGLKEALSLMELNELPLHLAENQYFMKSIVKQKDSGLITNSQVVNSQFLFSYLESKQLMILNSMKDLKLSAFRLIYNKPDASLDEKQLSKPHVIVINGAFGSGKNKFANNLTRYSRENRYNNCNVFSVSHQNLQNKVQVPVFISMIEDFVAEQPKRGSSITLIVLPCWVNSKQFLDLAQQKFHIKNVCTKITASNFYSTVNYELTENTLAYSTSGYSQFVFLDTYGENEQYLSEITNIIWGYTPESKVYSIENNSVNSGIARDIFSGDKYMKQSQIFLRNKYAVLYQFKFQNGLKFVQINFPVRVHDVIKKLKEQDGYLYSPKLIERELEKERAEAEGSKDELLITLFKIKERILTERRKLLSMRLKWIKGSLRFLEEKQIQEITWTPMFYRQKQNKNAPILGLSVLFNKRNEHEFQQFIDDLSEKGDFMKKIKQYLTPQTVTAAQIKAIELQNRDKYLENGEFFDGTFYRDCQGTVLKSHPKLHLLVKEYVELENMSREEENALVAGQWEAYKNSFRK